MLFVTENWLRWPSDEGDRALATVANDARASIHALETGGMLARGANEGTRTTVQQSLSLRSLRAISELTGGVAAIAETAQDALDRLDAITKTGYVLGYKSSRTAWDGDYRAIAVKVNRPDVKVLFRHGYLRAQGVSGFNRRGFVTNDRLAQAGSFRREVSDIKVKASASQRGDSLAVQIVTAAKQGCSGPNQMKAYLRCGMGPCQGRQCGLTVTELMAQTLQRSPSDIGHFRLRPPAKPITLSDMAKLPAGPDEKASVIRL